MANGILSSLFDISFSEFITTRIIKFLYLVAWVVSGAGALFLIISAFSLGALPGLLALCLAPIFFLLQVMVVRVWLELVAVVFTIAGHTAEIARQGQRNP